MRSAVLAGLLVLTGCEQKAPKPEMVTVDLEGSPTDVPPAAPAAPTIQTSDLPPPPPKVAQYQALGTEPFWSLKTAPGKLRYSSPEAIDGIEFSANVAVAGALKRYTGVLQGKPVVLTIEPGTCSDGMSDTVYAHKASFIWGERTEQGCAKQL
jgi:uncharacterized membrane protein